MHCKLPLLAASMLLSLTTLNAEASLTAYTAAGNQSVVYSSVSNVTWAGDANLLGTMMSNQGYNTVVNAIIAASPTISDTPNLYDTPANSGSYNISAADFTSSSLGATNWYGAKAFTSYLNSINYADSNQWVLPSAGTIPQSGSNQTGGQFGQLYYNELNALAWPGTNGSDYGILHDGSFGTSGNAGPFTNAQTNAYWYGTESAPNPDNAWIFFTSHGDQFNIFGKTPNKLYAWAISPGQVAAVPVSGTAWLFGAALLGLLGFERRGHVG